MVDEFRNFIVEAKVRLLRRRYDSDDEDNSERNLDYESNVVKVDENVKMDLEEFAHEEINKGGFLMWLYYTRDLPGLVFQVLDKNIAFSDHTFTVTVKARYIFPRKCPKEYLKKSVQGIFDHWFLAGYVSYILDEFNILSADQWGDELTPDIFVNLL